MKVLRRANSGVWGFFPSCFSKIVGCGVGFLSWCPVVVCEQRNVGGRSCFCGSCEDA